MAKLTVKTFPDSVAARDKYLLDIDRQAEQARNINAPATGHQAMTYDAKYREASTYPVGKSFPFLQAEAAALNKSVDEVVVSILAARQQWEKEDAKIEAKRLQAKQRLRSAQTPAEMFEISKSAFK